MVPYAARQRCIFPLLLFRLGRCIAESGKEAIRASEEKVVGSSEIKALEKRSREL